jgi:NAD(P)-dependent dehydrogenase (short-subunit alcohol dehydrogenase family)
MGKSYRWVDDVNDIYVLVDDTFLHGRIRIRQDIAKAAAFLASEESDWVGGQFLMVSGMLFP